MRLPSGVRKRANGTLEKRITVNGKRISIYGNTVKEISAKEQELKNKIQNGLYTINRNITLDGYFEEWLAGKRATTKSNSLRIYSSNFRKHISPELGKRKVQQIERREVMRLQSKLTACLSVTSVNNVMKTLKIILNDACNDEIISRSPASGIKAIKDNGKKATQTYHRALTKEEQRDFMAEMENDYYYEFVAILLCSGMRLGELGALSWRDIDYKNNVIHITKTLTLDEDGTLIIGDSPKSEAGKRDIPLTTTLKALITRWKNKIENIYNMNGCVFLTTEGKLVHNHAINRAISQALDRLEEQGKHIEHFTAHALRDTYATRYIEQGGNMQTLKSLLGHASLAMTADLYSHVLPDTKHKETENLTFDIAL